jgi:hypothetical protein
MTGNRAGRDAVQALVDAPVWIDYFTGVATPETDFLDQMIGREALVVSDLTIAEVLYGLPDEQHRRTAEQALLKFWIVTINGTNLASRSAVIYHTLRARGIEAHPQACLIAAYCLDYEYSLLTEPAVAEPFVRHFGLTVPEVGR